MKFWSNVSCNSFAFKHECLQCTVKTIELAFLFQYFWRALYSRKVHICFLFFIVVCMVLVFIYLFKLYFGLLKPFLRSEKRRKQKEKRKRNLLIKRKREKIEKKNQHLSLCESHFCTFFCLVFGLTCYSFCKLNMLKINKQVCKTTIIQNRYSSYMTWLISMLFSFS